MNAVDNAKKIPVPAMLADTDLLFKQAKQGGEPFSKAQAFPHIVIPGMIKTVCCTALAEGLFQWGGSAVPPSVVQLLLWELNSSTLIRHFASMTGSQPLLPDPFLINGGLNDWKSPVQMRHSGLEGFERHPQTDLKNTLRLEIILSTDPQAEASLEVLDIHDQSLSFQEVKSGTLLITGNDHYRLRYMCDDPSPWCSLISYYYVNDRARPIDERELSRDY